MPDKKIDRFWVTMLAGIIGMAFGALAIHLIDRFHANDTAWNFYSPSVDMTCMVARSRGQEVMSCLPGDHRMEVKHD